jgi:hypothetical protein
MARLGLGFAAAAAAVPRRRSASSPPLPHSWPLTTPSIPKSAARSSLSPPADAHRSSASRRSPLPAGRSWLRRPPARGSRAVGPPISVPGLLQVADDGWSSSQPAAVLSSLQVGPVASPWRSAEAPPKSRVAAPHPVRRPPEATRTTRDLRSVAVTP